ncbi:SDR family oxidoreductase [Nonomuraea dietziae]|uniref:SDR family oxidoreductase n=1 Tax=Nonomuraea dietziae TaxID=65515 RepID=UPI0033E1A429
MNVLGEGDIRRFLTERIASRLPSQEVDPDRPLEEFGLSSRDAVGIAGELADLLGRELPPTLVWEHPTVNRLAAALAPGAVTASPSVARAGGNEPIAVVGVGCRLPGAEGPEALWELLMEGRDAVRQVPDGRWEAFDDGSARTADAIARTTRHGGFLDDIAGFDAAFFGIPPGEAATMDPQQRLLLETAWEALEHGGIAPRALHGSRTGAFVGISGNEYAHLTTADPASVEAWTATGAAFSIAANRLSYLLDLRGPSMAVDTACSSSLVAVHLAVASLRAGESDLALAAGVNLLLSPVVTMAFDQAGGTSPSGRCRAFDASADGMVRAEGCGVVVMKRLSDALRDGDRVLAVVRATAVNQDGRSNGLVAPNPEAQEELLRTAYAGLDRGPDYVEAHGTGTFLGDPIEGRALAAALEGRILVGSVKTNLGHLEAAAGVTGLIKTVLALHHGVIPPSLHFREPNPHLPWDRLAVVTEPTPWPRPAARAGVSSFGFGGTNAHVVLDAFPAAARQDEPAARVFVLSDLTADRVRAHAADLAAWAETEAGKGAALGDVAATLARRAGRGRVGAAVVARDTGELARALASVEPVPAGGRGPVWVFSGYGAQWQGMGRDLYAAEPAFREAVDELAPLLAAEAGIDVHAWMGEGVAIVQPLIFAVQLGLARLWKAHGFPPAAVIGHSMGEVAAAVVAGGLSVSDGVRVICRRARLLGSLGGGGAMAVLEVAAEEVPEDLHVAVHSSPVQTVVTGDPGRVAAFAAEAAARGRMAKVLTAEGAGHSPQVRPLQPALRAELAAIAPGEPSRPFYSTVLEDPRETPAFDPAYWAAGIRRPVRLMQAVMAAAEDGFTVFTELGPHPVLAAPLRDTLPPGALVTHSLVRNAGPRAFEEQVARVAAAVPPRVEGRVTDVPRPRWRRKRHWVAAGPRPVGGHPLLGAHVETPAGHCWSTTLDDLSQPPWRLAAEVWHRHGHPVLPIEAVAQLARAALGGPAVSDVALYGLLPLPAQITTTLAGGRVEVHAKDAAGVWRMYGSAGEGPSEHALEKMATAGVAGTCGGIVTQEIRADEVPVRLADKLVERIWVRAPLAQGGAVPAREWLILADEGDSRAGRLASLVATSPDGDPLLLVPPRPDPLRITLQVARLAPRGGRLRIVTERAQAVLPGERGEPSGASLRGLVRVLALEHPELRAALIDVDDLSALASELAQDTGDDEVAWRDGVRYAARLRRADLPDPPDLPGLPDLRGAPVVREGGGYLITGGYGTLGLLAARWLAGRGAARVVLNGRSGPSPEAAAELARIGVAEVVTGDLAASGTVERLVEAATCGGIRLRGVVHAAGVLDDRLIADLTAESAERVWRAKALGGLRLHEATRGADLDWWVAYSSAAALLGSPGQAAYATANAYLDALCELRRAEGLPGVSIGWGTWAGATPLPAVAPLTPSEGMEALEALLRRELSAGVVRLDPATAVAVFPRVGRMPYFSMVVEGTAGREDLSALGHDEALEVIAGRVRERAAGVLGLDAPSLEEGVALTELGLDSLAATRLRGTIEHDFGVALPAGPLLRGATLGEIARLVASELGRGPQQETWPRDAAERLVVRVAEEVLGRAPAVGEALPAEALPLVAEGLAEELGQRARIDGAATVAEVADAVREWDEREAGRGVVRALTPGTAPPPTARPLFLAHPAGGTTGVYTRLAALLDVPVLGLERLEDTADVSDRAAVYVDAVRRTAPAPYRLGGWSFGGILAFEIARQLGDDVELVAMIDSGLPDELAENELRAAHARRYVDFSRYLSETYGAAVTLSYEELAHLGEQAQLDLTERRIKESGVLEGLSPAILRHQRTSHEDTRAIERYRCLPYGGRVVLYRSTEPTPWAVRDARYAHENDPARGFAPYAKNLEIVPVEGAHHLNLLDPPYVEIVAAHLRGLL